MIARFAGDARDIVRGADREAAAAGSPVIEAEHLLLALSALVESEAHRILAGVGLDHASAEAALQLEMQTSLAAAGVVLRDAPLPTPSGARRRGSRLAESAKAALRRALRESSGRSGISSTHLLLGVVTPTVGTVPRALAAVGVDRYEIAALAREALADSGTPP